MQTAPAALHEQQKNMNEIFHKFIKKDECKELSAF